MDEMLSLDTEVTTTVSLMNLNTTIGDIYHLFLEKKPSKKHVSSPPEKDTGTYIPISYLIGICILLCASQEKKASLFPHLFNPTFVSQIIYLMTHL